jgi:hypothetical protein
MELTLCHSIPGRIRLRVPALCHRPLLAETTLSWLRKQEGMKSARINYDCACLILEYDPVSAEALQDILDYVAGIGLDGLEALLSLPPRPSQTSTAGAEADDSWPQRQRPAAHPGVLALPTLSLGLAL